MRLVKPSRRDVRDEDCADRVLFETSFALLGVRSSPSGDSSICGPERTEQVANGFPAVVDRYTTDFRKSQRSVKGVRGDVRRIVIDFAYATIVARPTRLIEQVGVEQASIAAPPHGPYDNDTIHVYEPWVALTEPQVVWAVICRTFIEGEQKRIYFADPASVESPSDECRELVCIKPRQL